MFPARVVIKVSKATSNQINYWVRCGIVAPVREGRKNFFSFGDLIKIKLIVSLREQGLSLQKIKKGLDNLHSILHYQKIPLSKLLIHTDGIDMIVVEKSRYFSAITKQTYFRFDTEELKQEVINVFPEGNQVEQIGFEEELYSTK